MSQKIKNFGEPAVPPCLSRFPLPFPRGIGDALFFWYRLRGLVCFLPVPLRCDLSASAAIVGPQAGSFVSR
jgi:hypothetical protein